MNRELELGVRPEDAARFLRQLVAYRTEQLAEANRSDPGPIRDEHEGRAAAAGRLLEASSNWAPREALTLTASNGVERLVLTLTVDAVVQRVADGVRDLSVTDYDGLDEAADALAYWSKVARDFNAECDRLDDAELVGVGV